MALVFVKFASVPVHPPGTLARQAGEIHFHLNTISVKKYGCSALPLWFAALACLVVCIPANAQRKNAYGQKYIYTFVLIGEHVKDTFSFDDGMIKAIFAVRQTDIAFALKNQTGEPAKIHWEEASLTIRGTSERVLHSGILYGNRDQPQIPTTIPPGAQIRDFVFPAKNACYRQAQAVGMRVIPGGVDILYLLPMYDLDKQEFRDMILAHKDQKMGFFLPIEINGVKKNYTFEFRITGVASEASPDTKKRKR